MFNLHSLKLILVVYYPPLEYASIDLTWWEEVLEIVTEQTTVDCEQVVRVTLVVALACSVGIVKEPNRAQLVSNCHNGFA